MSGPGSSQTGSNQSGASSSDSRESGIGQSGSRRAASSLELFLDLAFVFAISQIATYLAEHLTVAGSLRALLLAWFAWWQWTAFTWAGATIDLKERGPIRVMVLCLVPVVLICSVALPRALADEPLWFAGAYCLIQLWVLSIQWVATAANPEGQAALRKYVPLAAIAPLVLLGSAFLPETPRLWAWIVVAIIFAGSALAAGRGEVGEWSVTASHFAERHSLLGFKGWSQHCCQAECRSWLSASPGVLQSRVLRGRELSASATASRSSRECRERSVPFGKY